MLAGALLVATLVLTAIFDLPRAVLTVVVMVVAVVVIVVGYVGWRRPVLVRLDRTGYQLSWLPRAGAKKARWADVEYVVTGFVPLVEGRSEAVVVIRLAAGQSSTIPVNLLAGSADDFARDIRSHLH